MSFSSSVLARFLRTPPTTPVSLPESEDTRWRTSFRDACKEAQQRRRAIVIKPLGQGLCRLDDKEKW